MNIESHDGIVVIRMNTGKANAMGPRFLNALNRAFDEISTPDTMAAVLTGYENYFSAGLELPVLMSMERDEMLNFMRLFSSTMRRLLTWPRPLVAAINGHAIAGGCVLALQADQRIMAEGPGRIGLNEVQIGLGLPALVVETLRLRVPPGSLVPLALHGRLVEPSEALRLELVDRITPPEALVDNALQVARELAGAAHVAYAQVKATLLRPTLNALDAAEEDLPAWLDTWFSDEGKERIAATVARLSGRG